MPRYYPASKTGGLDSHRLGNDFAVSLDKFKFKSLELAEKAVKKIVLGLYDEIVETSPIDTGLFRSNHQIGIGSAPGGVVYAERPVKGQQYDYKSQNVQQKAKMDAFKLDTITYICNNLVYAIPLEYGHSTQAPMGTYRKALLKLRTTLG